MKNIFENITDIKKAITSFAEEAKDNAWIEEEDFNKICSDLKKEKITIGIVGQMKNGKSTLLNALIFGKDVLPSSTTPMTANLTEISYSEKEGAEVEFFSPDEWEQIKDLAKRDDDSSFTTSAKQMVQEADKIKNELPGLLGQKNQISFNDFEDYVGAKGKFVPITKSVKIFNSDPKLLNADFVDTPGFNDPVISREQRTKDFLDKADVVIVVLFAGRPFDRQDRSILFDQIRMVGVGKLILLINKYDLVIDEYGSEERVLVNVSKKLKTETDKMEQTDPILASIFKECKPILFSSLFALFGKMDINQTTRPELIGFYEYFKENFPLIKNKSDFFYHSKLSVLEAEIEKILKMDRLNIIIKKPFTELIGKIKKQGYKEDQKNYRIEQRKSSSFKR